MFQGVKSPGIAIFGVDAEGREELVNLFLYSYIVCVECWKNKTEFRYYT